MMSNSGQNNLIQGEVSFDLGLHLVMQVMNNTCMVLFLVSLQHQLKFQILNLCMQSSVFVLHPAMIDWSCDCVELLSLSSFILKVRNMQPVRVSNVIHTHTQKKKVLVHVSLLGFSW